MRRLVAIGVVTALVPIVAWSVADAEPDPPADCSATTASVGEGCVAPAPAAPVEPVTQAPPTPEDPGPTSTTTVPGDTVPVDPATTTTAPAATTTVPVDTTTTVGATTTAPASTTPVVDPGAPTSSVDPEAPTTTLDPNTTTTVDPNATTATLDPNTTTTTTPPPPPVEDMDSAPVAPPVEAPGGRVVIPAGAADGGQVRPITFPVAGPITYVNDFGACRDGCARAHKGNDLIGDRLQPILAMHDGVIDHLIEHPTAGFGVAIRDDEGWRYDVYHMNNDDPGTDDASDDGSWRFADGVTNGVRVTAGQLIGWMGDSGNSEGSVPHAHVEIHTPDGTPVNPYWSLRQAQRDVNCATLTATAAVNVAALTDAAAALAAGTAPAEDLVAAAFTAAADATWLDTGWLDLALPAGWMAITLTGGRPLQGGTAARMWISPDGFTPVDNAALLVGDPRYDVGVDCADPATNQVAPSSIPTELGAILATIRAMETGGDYGISVTTSTASGAYAFLDSSWGGYGGYRRAKDAPPAVQDAKAAELASYILARNGGDVSTIPVSWYIGHVPVGAEWDTVPRPDAGNRLTPREYQDRWMRRYAQFLGQPDAWVGGISTWTPVDTSVTCRTVVVDVGEPGHPELVLTQAQSFVERPSGRAGLNDTDACDPGRAPVPTPDPIAPSATPPAVTDAVATEPTAPPAIISEPVIRTGGRR